jgi:hypothetical protein
MTPICVSARLSRPAPTTCPSRVRVACTSPWANTGKLSRVDTCGSAPVDLQMGLSHPTGLVIGVDGAAYVTNKTLAPTGMGEVLRIPLD